MLMTTYAARVRLPLIVAAIIVFTTTADATTDWRLTDEMEVEPGIVACVLEIVESSILGDDPAPLFSAFPGQVQRNRLALQRLESSWPAARQGLLQRLGNYSVWQLGNVLTNPAGDFKVRVRFSRELMTPTIKSPYRTVSFVFSRENSRWALISMGFWDPVHGSWDPLAKD